jgi:hypothetical protein
MAARWTSTAITILCLGGAIGMASDRQSANPMVRPLYDVRSPERSPFPSDAFTVADTNQLTGRRVNLPMPDCNAAPSDCEDVAILNQLDGFNMQARVSVPFDGEIDPSSVTSKTVFLMKLGEPRSITGINNVVWDPATRELSFRPDVSLEQHARYALVVTTGVRDAAGRPIAAANSFKPQPDQLRAAQQIGQ